MNIEELEAALRKLDGPRPSERLAERVLSQRPPGGPETVAWWRRRVSVPVPALAAAIILVVVAQFVLWTLGRPNPDGAAQPSTTPAMQDVQSGVGPARSVALAAASRGPDVSITMTGNCSFHLER